MRRVKAFALCFGLAVGSLSTPASSDVIFQSIPNLFAQPDVNGWCSSCNGNYRIFDAFYLKSDTSIGSATFAVTSGYNFPSDVDVSIWTIGQLGTPDTQLFSQTFSPAQFVSVVNTQFDTSLVTINLPYWALTAGRYDISFYNPNGLAIPGYGGGLGGLYEEGYGFHNDSSAGFILNSAQATVSAVPEPSTWAMMLIGFAGLGFMAYRRGRRPVRVSA
jgi:hypothetical protein